MGLSKRSFTWDDHWLENHSDDISTTWDQLPMVIWGLNTISINPDMMVDGSMAALLRKSFRKPSVGFKLWPPLRTAACAALSKGLQKGVPSFDNTPPPKHKHMPSLFERPISFLNVCRTFVSYSPSCKLWGR